MLLYKQILCIQILNFTTKWIGVQSKAFSFLSYIVVDTKSTKGGGRLQSDCKTICKKRKDSSSAFTHSGKV